VRVIDDARRARTVGRLAGEVDLAVAPDAGRTLLAVARHADGPVVGVDCAELTFIDASGVTMLLDVVQRSGKALQLVNLITRCRRVFEVLDLCEWFGIEAPQKIALGGT
jgi:anti-anti-sigma factor